MHSTLLLVHLSTLPRLISSIDYRCSLPDENSKRSLKPNFYALDEQFLHCYVQIYSLASEVTACIRYFRKHLNSVERARKGTDEEAKELRFKTSISKEVLDLPTFALSLSEQLTLFHSSIEDNLIPVQI